MTVRITIRVRVSDSQEFEFSCGTAEPPSEPQTVLNEPRLMDHAWLSQQHGRVLPSGSSMVAPGLSLQFAS